MLLFCILFLFAGSREQQKYKTKEKYEIAKSLLFLQEISEQGHVPVEEKPKTCCTFTVLRNLEKSRQAPPALCVKPSVTTEQAQVELQRLFTANAQLKVKLEEFKMTQDSFRENDDNVSYTGLPNYASLEVVLFPSSQDLTPFCNDDNVSYTGLPNYASLEVVLFPSSQDLTPFCKIIDKLLMTLLQLKLNLHVKDLAYRFKASQSSVSRFFYR